MSRPKPATAAPAAPFQVNPFAELKIALPTPVATAAVVSSSPELKGATSTPTSPVLKSPAPHRPVLHVHYERKGRGGKTVTIIGGFSGLPQEALLELAQQLRKALGTGGAVFDAEVELQGDQRTRAAAWLQSKGWIVKGDLPAR